LALFVPIKQPPNTDCIQDTLDYDEVADRIHEMLKKSRFNYLSR